MCPPFDVTIPSPQKLLEKKFRSCFPRSVFFSLKIQEFVGKLRSTFRVSAYLPSLRSLASFRSFPPHHFTEYQPSHSFFFLGSTTLSLAVERDSFLLWSAVHRSSRRPCVLVDSPGVRGQSLCRARVVYDSVAIYLACASRRCRLYGAFYLTLCVSRRDSDPTTVGINHGVESSLPDPSFFRARATTLARGSPREAPPSRGRVSSLVLDLSAVAFTPMFAQRH